MKIVAKAAMFNMTVAARARRWLLRERHLVGASLLRIGLGTIVLYQLVGQWTVREFLWGPDGVYPLWLFARELPRTGAPSFFAVEGPILFHVVYGIAITVALLYVLGWQTRWVGIWLYVAVWSLIKRNPMLVTGGDTLVLVMLPFVLLMNTSSCFSVDSRWRAPAGVARPAAAGLAALAHNVGLCGVFVQLSLFYGFAGFYKLFGETWRDGTAVYYALRLPEFAVPGVSEHVYVHAPVVFALTYATLVFELSVPLLIWSRHTRWMVTAQALGFHLFIAIVLGLVVFSAQALVFHLVIFGDGRYAALVRRWLRTASW